MSVSRISVDAFCWALGWTLVHFLWQGALIAILLACVLSLLHRRSAQLRYALCCVALAAMVAAPLITFGHLSRSGIHTGPITVAALPDRGLPIVGGSGLHDSLLHRLVALVDRSTPLLLGLWLAGVVVLLVRLGAGLVVVQRMKRIGILPVSAELELGFQQLLQRLSIARPVRLLHSALVQVPTVAGWLRPVILVPVGFLVGLSTEQVEAILAHELAHIQRHDYLVSVLQALTEAMLFYHPAVWWVSKRIRAEREHCCDDLAVTTAGNAIQYARALSLLEERRSNTPLIALAANGGVLTMRIQRILGLAKGPVFPQPAAVLLLAALIAGISFTAIGRTQSPVPPQSTVGASGDESHLQGPYKAWLDEDVRWIIKPEERMAFLHLPDDMERDHFIQQFWNRRDPAGSATGTYRTEHYRRISYANQHFAAGMPGWETGRGRIYILFGSPTSVDSHPAGDAQDNEAFEVWTYNVVPGVGRDYKVRFVDWCKCGNYEVASGSVGEMDKNAR